MRLNEILDTKAPIDWKSESNESLLGTFSYKDVDFSIVIERAPFNQFKVYNIAFQRKDGEDFTSEAPTTFNANFSSILGIIVNGIMDKIATMDWDILIIGATTLIDKRMRIYNDIIIKRMDKLGNSTIYKNHRTTPNGTALSFVVKNELITDPETFTDIEKIINKPV